MRPSPTAIVTPSVRQVEHNTYPVVKSSHDVHEKDDAIKMEISSPKGMSCLFYIQDTRTFSSFIVSFISFENLKNSENNTFNLPDDTTEHSLET